MLSVRIPKDLEAKLVHLSALVKKPKSTCVREALEVYLEDLEDYMLAVEALKEHEESGEDLIPFEEVKRQLELDTDEKVEN